MKIQFRGSKSGKKYQFVADISIADPKKQVLKEYQVSNSSETYSDKKDRKNHLSQE